MHAQVLSTQRLTPSLVRVVLGGDGLRDFAMPATTDAYVNLAFPPADAPYAAPFDPAEVRETHAREHWPARRRYTVRSWDASAQELTLDFVVHGDVGVAGAWAWSARPGDLLVLEGPSGGYHPDAEHVGEMGGRGIARPHQSPVRAFLLRPESSSLQRHRSILHRGWGTGATANRGRGRGEMSQGWSDPTSPAGRPR